MLVLAATLIISPSLRLSPGCMRVGPDGRVLEVAVELTPHTGERVCTAGTVIPGFVDIHNHGVGGTGDVATYWSAPAATARAAGRAGTTAMLATIVLPSSRTSHIGCAADLPCSETGPPSSSPSVVDLPPAPPALLSVIGVPVPGCAVIEGIHAEGPIIADYGGLPVSEVTMPLDRFEVLLDSLPGLRVMTISPSRDAKDSFSRIAALCRRGIVPAFGHDKVATISEILAALRTAQCTPVVSGGGPILPHVTHLFNVTTFHHREPGLGNVGILGKFPNLPEYAGLSPPSSEIIGDMLHVHPTVVQCALDCKPRHLLTFVTDAVAPPVVGTVLAYDTRFMEVVRCSDYVPDGDPRGACVVLQGTRTLAGSCATMHSIFTSLVTTFGLTLCEASQLCSQTPATIARLSHVGTLEVGKRCDFICLGDDLSVEAVYVAGQSL